MDAARRLATMESEVVAGRQHTRGLAAKTGDSGYHLLVTVGLNHNVGWEGGGIDGNSFCCTCLFACGLHVLKLLKGYFQCSLMVAVMHCSSPESVCVCVRVCAFICVGVFVCIFCAWEGECVCKYVHQLL